MKPCVHGRRGGEETNTGDGLDENFQILKHKTPRTRLSTTPLSKLSEGISVAKGKFGTAMLRMKEEEAELWTKNNTELSCRQRGETS